MNNCREKATYCASLNSKLRGGEIALKIFVHCTRVWRHKGGRLVGKINCVAHPTLSLGEKRESSSFIETANYIKDRVGFMVNFRVRVRVQVRVRFRLVFRLGPGFRVRVRVRVRVSVSHIVGVTSRVCVSIEGTLQSFVTNCMDIIFT